MIKSTFQLSAVDRLDSKRFTTKFNKVVQGLGAQVANDLLPELAVEFKDPGPVRYPIHWASERQRRAFFATNGFGGGIPTKRTGKSNRAWKLVYISSGDAKGEMSLQNSVGYTKYVRGDFKGQHMQPFHRNTGWESSKAVRDRVFLRAKQLIDDRFDESLGLLGDLSV